MYRISIFFYVFLLSIGSIQVAAQTLNITSGHAEVKGKAPANSYTGVSDKLEGSLDIASGKVDFKIPLESIDTGIKKRNEHMKKALESSQFPLAEFHGFVKTPIDMSKQQPQEVQVSGEFSIHGQTRKIDVTAQLTPSENGLKFSAQWPILITEYGIQKPKVGFYKVKDLHHISISGVLKQ